MTKLNIPIANISLIILGALVLLSPPADPDFGWHYKYGEYFVQNGKILRENIFSYTLPDYQWANTYWASQIIIYLLHNKLGAFWLSFITGLIFSAFVVFTIRKQPYKNKFLIIILLSVLLYEFSTTVRPLIFSNIFFLYLFNTLLKYNPKSKPFYFLPVIFLLWSNMHADFIIGLAIMIFFALHAVKKPYFKQVALILVLSFMATLVGPYGIQLWKTLILEANPEIISFQEFSPTYIQPIGTLIIGSGIILFIYLFKKENLNWFTFVLIGSFLLGVEAIYFMRIYLMACLVILDQIFSS